MTNYTCPIKESQAVDGGDLDGRRDKGWHPRARATEGTLVVSLGTTYNAIML
jgi:hypothetical protein